MPVVVVGAGAVGRLHAQRMTEHEDVVLAGVADPSAAAREFAHQAGVPWAPGVDELLHLEGVRPGAAIVATPNALHAESAIACISHGLPVLVEKPIADTIDSAQRITAAARERGVPLLVGHQRRHNAAVQFARSLIERGAFGRVVGVTLMATWLKPDAYFAMAWRRQPGGGPVLINLIHDIDLLRFLVGEVLEVKAFASSAQRGLPVEDTAAAVLRLSGGALATALVSDAAVAPWNYDLAAGEVDHYPRQLVDSMRIVGSEGSLALPSLQIWRYAGPRARWGWQEPLTSEHAAVQHRDPFAEQLRHLRAVAEGRETPLCSGEDATGTLRVTLALLQAAAATRAPKDDPGAALQGGSICLA
jgi:predicted dehydrogenase